MLDIKKIISDPWILFPYIATRFRGFEWMNDDLYLKLMFRAKMGKRLNLDNPQTFNEKIQWLKLYDRKRIYTKMVDKYEVKHYVKEKIGDKYIIPTYGIWDSFEDIDFDKLPDKFVIKCTHDSGGLIICRNKADLDYNAARIKITNSLKQRYYWIAREWPYKNVKPRIIAEQYMDNIGEDELTDYKWFCFNGVPQFLYISHGLENHETATIDFYDMNHHRMPFKRTDYKSSIEDVPKPVTYNEMVEIATKLSKDIPFVRIDLYEIRGHVYFSEITFYPCAGWLPFDPPEWDLKLGDYIELPSKEKRDE